MVNAQKRNRLESERQVVLNARAVVVSYVYDEYKMSLSPRSWPHLPSFERILHSEPFWSLYNNPSGAPLDPASFASGKSQLPTIISAWRDELKDKLTRLVPVQTMYWDRPIHLDPEEIPPADPNLELATPVFTCYGCCEDGDYSGSCLIGWDDVMNHLSCLRMFRFGDNPMSYSRIGHYTVMSVMRLLDLHTEKVTAKELDERNERFLCANCPIAVFRGVCGHKAFTWRECVRFFPGH